ncbi:MAG: hypothetical protein KGQ51_16260 [Planctomycetes bacterium]|nr:hypothetical protein [Planctomycetota bacterium]
MGRNIGYLVILAAGSLSSLWSNNTAHAHFPFRPHCFARPLCPPCPPRVVWGGCYPRVTSVNLYGTGIWGTSFHRSFYAINGGCWPSYSFYSCAPVVAAPVCYPPVYYQPICYPPVYYRPVYYRPVVVNPVCYDPFLSNPILSNPIVSQQVLQASSLRVNSLQRNLAQRTQLQSKSPQATSAQLLVNKPLLVNKQTALKNSVASHRTPSIATTYSPVWTESAIGLIDEMMERGEWELAYQSLARMEKISTPLNHRVVLRQAVMDLVAHRDQIDVARMDRVMDLLNKAADAGSPFSPEDFRGASLSKYLQASDIELSPILDKLAQRVLQQPERSGRELLLLSVLLKLDGQQERSLLFAKESRTLAARSDAFRWKSVLQSLDRQIDQDALLAAKD